MNPVLFWAKVGKSESEECWEWQGSRNSRGYGLFGVGSRKDGTRGTARAHRLAWELANGPIPAGLKVLHTCDNPSCVKPGHLFLGTDAANAADRATKGRNADHKGQHNPRAKLTNEQAQEIRHRYVPGNGYQLAREFGVDRKQITRIVQGTAFYDAITNEKGGEE